VYQYNYANVIEITLAIHDKYVHKTGNNNSALPFGQKSASDISRIRYQSHHGKTLRWRTWATSTSE